MGARSGTWQRVFRTRPEDTLPVRIEHRRIYILPTRRGWAFLGSLALMLVATINYSLSLGYALCFLLSGLFSATLLHTYRNLAGLELARVEADVAFAGERLPFAITLANPTRRARHGLRVAARANADGTGGEVRTDVAAQALVRATLEVPTAARGTRELGRLTLASDWPLGLWRTWSYVHASVAGIVFPAPETEPPPLPAAPAAADGAAPRRGTRGDVAGLRPYAPGDAPSTIAWKSLARGQGLHVRTFDDESGPAHARLTLASARLPELEARLSRLAAWVLAAERTGRDYVLELPGTSPPTAHGPAGCGPAERGPAERGPERRRAALTALALHGDAAVATGAASSRAGSAP